MGSKLGIKLVALASLSIVLLASIVEYLARPGEDRLSSNAIKQKLYLCVNQTYNLIMEAGGKQPLQVFRRSGEHHGSIV